MGIWRTRMGPDILNLQAVHHLYTYGLTHMHWNLSASVTVHNSHSWASLTLSFPCVCFFFRCCYFCLCVCVCVCTRTCTHTCQRNMSAWVIAHKSHSCVSLTLSFSCVFAFVFLFSLSSIFLFFFMVCVCVCERERERERGGGRRE